MRTRSFLLSGALILLLFPINAAAGQPLAQVVGEGLEPVALESDFDLSLLLSSLKEERNITPEGPDAFRAAADPDILLVPLERPDRPEVRLFLYYLPERQESFFLQIEPDPIAGATVRLWGEEASEILMTQGGIVLLTEPSETTFRLGLQSGARDPRVQLDSSVTETLACIARTLGISLNTTTLKDLLSSATCSAASTLALVLTAYSCLNPTPVGILACTVGITKIIACNFAKCSDLPPSSCLGTITVGQRANGSWDSSCTAAHRSGRFAKYYTFTLAATKRVQMDLEALLADPYLILLNGSGSSGTVLATDDDSGVAWNSRITLTLAPGTYTLEATTYSSQRTGSFTVSVSQR